MVEGPAFELRRPPDGVAVPVLVHVPHAGTALPDDVRAELLLDDAGLERELLLMTDHLTDRLADGAGEAGAALFVDRLSRLVVDPERFTDGSEPMEAVGMGAVYARTAHGEVLRDVTEVRRAQLLRRYFEPYAEALAGAVGELVDRYGSCAIVDLHSYPSRVLPYELEPTAPRPEVCIGTDDLHTPAWLRDAVVAACHGAGLGYAFDVPFAGTYVPTAAYRQDDRVRSVMLELRRDTYLDEATATPHDGFARMQRFVADVVGAAAAGP